MLVQGNPSHCNRLVSFKTCVDFPVPSAPSITTKIPRFKAILLRHSMSLNQIRRKHDDYKKIRTGVFNPYLTHQVQVH